MVSLKLLRLVDDQAKQTRGVLLILNDTDIVFTCKTLELPDRENKKNISRIPAGAYWSLKRYSSRFKNHIWIQDVEERSMILIHSMNYVSDTQGCIGVGKSYTDMNADGLLDLTESRITLDKILSLVPDCVQIEIIDTVKLENNPCL